MFKGLIGKKIGMTQIFDEAGAAVPVTLIEAGPCYVTQVRTADKEGYSAVQLGFNEVKPKRLTQGELAGKLRIRQNMVSDYERGRRLLSGAMARRFGSVLQVREEQLAYGSKMKKPNKKSE